MGTRCTHDLCFSKQKKKKITIFVVVLCCMFFGVRVSVALRVFILFLVRFRLLGGQLWEIPAHSVDHMFFLYFDCL